MRRGEEGDDKREEVRMGEGRKKEVRRGDICFIFVQIAVSTSLWLCETLKT